MDSSPAHITYFTPHRSLSSSVNFISPTGGVPAWLSLWSCPCRQDPAPWESRPRAEPPLGQTGAALSTREEEQHQLGFKHTSTHGLLCLQTCNWDTQHFGEGSSSHLCCSDGPGATGLTGYPGMNQPTNLHKTTALSSKTWAGEKRTLEVKALHEAKWPLNPFFDLER